MKLAVGAVFVIVSIAAFLLASMLSGLYHGEEARAVQGMAFAWCAPFAVAGVALIHNRNDTLGRLGHGWYMFATLCCLLGTYPQLHRDPNLTFETVFVAFFPALVVIAGFVISLLLSLGTKSADTP